MTDTPCSLTNPAWAERAEEWRSISGALTSRQPTGTGAELHYRLDPIVGATLARLIEAEGRCCGSLSFEATVVVRIEAPPSMRPWVEEVFVRGLGDDAGDFADRQSPALDREHIEDAVRSHYAAAAVEAVTGCSSDGASSGREEMGIGAAVYGSGAVDGLPAQVVETSIGCANPVAVAELAEGEAVLDLGSGGGIDVLLSARRVGATGKAYGLDMTDEMLEVARTNTARAGVENAEFRRGRIEAVPLPDASVDVVLSNCVIGLSTDKNAVFAEAYRVLRPGGRLAIADVVSNAEARRVAKRHDAGTWVSCVAGALTRAQYREFLADAGFREVSLAESHAVGNGLSSVIVRARKPV